MERAHIHKKEDADVFDLDMRQLVVFEQLMQERNATKAAGNLGISQPTVSYVIKRLRKIFDDPLFMPGGSGLVPTRKAHDIQRGVSDILLTLRRRVLLDQKFSHASSTRNFKIAMTDYFQQTLLPGFLRSLRYAAPNITFTIVSLPADHNASMIKKQRACILKELSEGNIELALDNTLVGYEEFLYKEIMSDRWCLTGPADRIVTSIGEDPEKRRWAQVGADRPPQDDDKQSSPAILADSYTAVALAMVATGCVAAMPQRVAQHLARFYQIKVLPAADEERPISCYQFWSNVVTRSLEHEWLRHVISTYCTNI